MDDCRKRQTSTATPAEPGDLPWGLVTEVTVGEVKSQLQELVTEANSALIKHSGILEQLGASGAVERVRDQTAALSTLEAAFDQFFATN